MTETIRVSDRLAEVARNAKRKDEYLWQTVDRLAGVNGTDKEDRVVTRGEVEGIVEDKIEELRQSSRY